MDNKIKIAIVGGGAAGMMAAASICEQNQQNFYVHLFEKNNKLGAKVLISGGGRCNVTTGIYKKNELLKKYPRGSEFLDYVFSKFGPRKIRSWFENHGVKLKEEDDKRIFPVSNKGSDIVGVFEKMFEKNNIHVHYGENILDIHKDKSKSDSKFVLSTDQSVYEFDCVIITTGGNAYAHTGSTGDGYNFAKALGHTITTLGPSLNSFLIEEERIKSLSGISFENAGLSILLDKKISISGPILLTHFGISGPSTFVISSYSAFENIDKNNPLKIQFRPISNYDYNRWNNLFLDYIRRGENKEIQNILSIYLVKRFVFELLKNHKIDGKLKILNMTKTDRELISNILGNGISLTAINRRPGDEFVTAGGVSLDEVNPKKMESKVCPGLFFAGEILDIDGFTGGFNLQSSWATGMLAGLSVYGKGE